MLVKNNYAYNSTVPTTKSKCLFKLKAKRLAWYVKTAWD